AHGTWESAIEHYHSYDPDRRQVYRLKVFSAWNTASARRAQVREASGVSELPLSAETRVSAMVDAQGPMLGARGGRGPLSASLEFPWAWQPPAPVATTSADMITYVTPPDSHKNERARDSSGPRVVIPVDLSPRASDRLDADLITAAASGPLRVAARP